MNFFAILSFISAVVSFFFGTVVIVKGFKKLENKIFSILCYSVSLLGFIEYFFRTYDDYEDILFWTRFYSFVAFLPCLIVHFVLVINEKLEKIDGRLAYSIIYGPGILFFVLGIFTDVFGEGFRREYWGWTYGIPENPIFLYLFFLWFLIVMIFCLVVCIQNYKNPIELNKKLQIKYIGIGLLFMLTLFIVFDSIIIEILKINFPEMATTGYSVFCVILAYPMWKYELFSMNFQDLVETSSRGFLELNMIEWKLEYINPKLLSIFGYSKEEIEQSSLYYKLIHPEDLLHITKIREETEREFRIISKKGEIKWLSGKISPHHDKNGKIISLRLWLDEITDKKNLEDLKEKFIRRTSHELKTPLISIKGFAELILSMYEDELNPDIISKLGEITQGCERLQNIVTNLLKTSKLESPGLIPKLEEEDLSFLINYCVNDLYSLAAKREHSINTEIHNSIITRFEKEEIHDVITNLISNAIKYTPPKGMIDIKTEVLEDSVIVSIKDNGIGFTEDEKQKIFQQFGKIERYGQGLDLDIGGTGLGLYISKQIIESHGGKIWMHSEGKNKGSTFFFSLPIIKTKDLIH